MFRNVVTAALRNLARNRLYAAISVASLAIGMAVVLLTFLFVRDELTFDHFVPGYERIFVVVTKTKLQGAPLREDSATPSAMAAWLRMAV